MRSLIPKGFTLVEMIVTISISSILFLGVTSMIVTIYRSNNEAMTQARYVDSARRGIETLVKDAREIDYAVTGSYPILTALPNQFSFYADIDPDDTTEFIIYNMSSTELVRTVYSATGSPPAYSSTPDTVETLATYVHNELLGIPTFTYFDRHGSIIADSATNFTAIRSVQVELHISLDESATSSSFQLQGSATLRNLRDRL